MSDWNEEQAKAKDARRGVTEQSGRIHAKKKKAEPGRYTLQQRVDPDSELGRYMRRNDWAQHRDLSWADFDEASRVGRIFARKNKHYQYRLLDSVTGGVTFLNGE